MRRIATIITLIVVTIVPSTSYALSNLDARALEYNTVFYNENDSSLLANCPASGASGTASPTASLPATMTLDQKIGQTMIVGFDASTPKATIEALFTKYHFGGMYVLNTSDAAAAGFDAAFYAKLGTDAGVPIVASSDEEGGMVTRYAYPAGSFPAAASMGANAQKIGTAAGAIMKQNGLTTDLAPVLDLRDVGTGLTGRSFSNDPTTVAAQAGAFATGLDASGITPIFKHFPGFDSTTSGTTDDTKIVMSGSIASTTAPYAALVAKFPNAGVMMSNMYVNALDSANPTSLSAKSVAFLRSTIGFEGMITTDDLAVTSVTSATGSLANSVAKSLAAGVTMPLFKGPSDAGLQAIINQVKASVSSTVISAADAKVISFKNGKAGTSVSSSGCCAGTNGTTTLVGGDNPTKIYNYLVGKGLKGFQAVGIMANLQAESGMDPNNSEDGKKDPVPINGVGFGIAQWTFTSRQAPLVALAAQEKLPPISLTPQLDDLWRELSSDYASSVLTPLKTTTTYDQAVTLVMLKFESPADQSQTAIQGRISGGQPLLTKYAGGSGAGGSGGSSTSSGGTCSAVGSTSGDSIVKIALAELGTNEGNGGTPNGGPSCKYQGTACPQDWCADFVSWVFKQAGVPFTTGADGGWRIAAATSVGDWFKANGTWIANPGKPVPVGDPSAPKPGDVVVFADGSHTNIVVSYDGKTVVTVGGNEANAVSTYPEDIFSTAIGWGRLK